MLRHDVEDYLAAVEANNREFASRFQELDEAFRAQAEGSVFSVAEWLQENASAEPVAAVSLAARLESRHQPKPAAPGTFLISSLAVASVVAVLIHLMNMRKGEHEVADAFQKI